MTQEEFLTQIVRMLEAAGIPCMVTGSNASSYHGQPRATNDADLVIDPSAAQLEKFIALVGDQFYLSPEAAREALARRSMFNVIDFNEGWKADLIVRKDRPFSREEMSRRQPGTLYGQVMPIASAEDVVLAKLEWNLISPSERQLQDALNVIRAQEKNLDQAYLRKWAAELGVNEQLEKLLQSALGK